MKNLPSTIAIEVLTGLLIGGVPVFLIFVLSDYDSMIKVLTGIAPSDEIVIYFGALSLIHLFFHFSGKLVLKKLNPKLEEEKPNIFIESLKNAGTSLHGVYRALLGAVPVATGITIWLHFFKQGALALTFVALIFWLGCLFMCVISTNILKK